MHGGDMGMGNAFGNGSYGMGWCLPVPRRGAVRAARPTCEDRGLLEQHAGRGRSASSAARRGSTRPTAIPGRQHWPDCYSAILAGGGIRGGAVYGESDKIGAYVKDRPVRPQDLGATIYHALGVPFESRVTKDGAVEAAEHRDAAAGFVRVTGDGWGGESGVRGL